MEQERVRRTPIVVIIEAETYRQAKERYDQKLMEEIECGFTHPLACDPLFGHAVPLTKELFYFDTWPFRPRIPIFRILYHYSPSIDPLNVELLYIELINYEQEINDE